VAKYDDSAQLEVRASARAAGSRVSGARSSARAADSRVSRARRSAAAIYFR